MAHSEEGLEIRTGHERSLKFNVGPTLSETYVIYTHPPEAAEDGVAQLYDLAIEHLLAARARLGPEVIYDQTEEQRANGIIAVIGCLVALRQDQLDNPLKYPAKVDYSVLLTRAVIYGEDQHRLSSDLLREDHMRVPHTGVTILRNTALRKIAKVDNILYGHMLEVLGVSKEDGRVPHKVIAAMRKPFEAHETRVATDHAETLYI
jgi:hypothetical protein